MGEPEAALHSGGGDLPRPPRPDQHLEPLAPRTHRPHVRPAYRRPHRTGRREPEPCVRSRLLGWGRRRLSACSPMADYWAAAAMMAGHPNGVSMLSLRNVPFALQVGANDADYNRNKVGKEYGEILDRLQKNDPKGYEHFVKIREGKGHWMGREDKVALPWMAKFTRNPVPERVVWKQTGTLHDRSYWLAVPTKEAKGDSLVVATRSGQTVEITSAEKVTTLFIRLDDRMTDLDKPVEVKQAGKVLFNGIAPRTVATMLKTLVGRGDRDLVFDAEVEVTVGEGK